MRPFVPAFVLLAAVAAALLGGCAEPKHPVSGKVVDRRTGKPVGTGAIVLFESVKKPHPRSKGVIGPDGTFRLSTDRAADGAFSGEHRVCILPLAGDGSGRDLTTELSRTIDPKFFELRTSGLTLTIDPDSPNEFLVEVEGPPEAARGATRAPSETESPPAESH